MRGTFVACLLACAASSCARADVILLRNGDRISGEAVRKSGAELVVKTPYAGEITLPWAEIASITSDRPVLILFEGEAAPVLRRLDPSVALGLPT